MILYHYTCGHSYQGIKRDGKLKGNPHPYIRTLGPLIWLTDLDAPDRAALGLTSLTLQCDRTQFRAVVEVDLLLDEDVVHWPQFARRLQRSTREMFESDPGVRPMHWYVALQPFPVRSLGPVPEAIRGQ
jgi:hypothetical protein